MMVFTSVLENAFEAAGANFELLPDKPVQFVTGMIRKLDTVGLAMRAGM